MAEWSTLSAFTTLTYLEQDAPGSIPGLSRPLQKGFHGFLSSPEGESETGKECPTSAAEDLADDVSISHSVRYS